MKQFNDNIKDNPKVAMIHLSRDREEDAAESWAAEAKFPWLTILPDDIKKTDLLQYRTGNGVPHYVLVTSDGKPAARGSGAVFAKLKELNQ